LVKDCFAGFPDKRVFGVAPVGSPGVFGSRAGVIPMTTRIETADLCPAEPLVRELLIPLMPVQSDGPITLGDPWLDPSLLPQGARKRKGDDAEKPQHDAEDDDSEEEEEEEEEETLPDTDGGTSEDEEFEDEEEEEGDEDEEEEDDEEDEEDEEDDEDEDDDDFDDDEEEEDDDFDPDRD
jgi:hypothetical protein